MNLITRRAVRAAIGVLAIAVSAVALAGPALASHVSVRTTVPDQMMVGDTVEIPVALSAANGAPLQGASVVFYLHASFGGVEGEAVIGRAVTDETGVAALVYTPRLAGQHQIRIDYVEPGQDAVEAVSTVFDVSGGEQLYRFAPGPDIPGLNVGLLMAVVATVWAILFGVTLLLVAVARAGGERAALDDGQAR